VKRPTWNRTASRHCRVRRGRTFAAECPQAKDQLLNYTISRRRYLHGFLSGHDESTRVGPILTRYRALATREAIAVEQMKACAVSCDGLRARLRLRARLELGVGLKTALQLDRVETLMAKKPVVVDGDEINYRDAAARSRMADSHDERLALERARNCHRHELASEMSMLWEQRRKAIHALTDLDYVSSFAFCNKVDVVTIMVAAKRILANTNDVYHAALAYWAPRIVGCVGEACGYEDLAWIQYGQPWRGMITPSRIRSAVEGLIHLISEPSGATHIRLDLDNRPAKSARPYTAPIQVPYEIYLVARPMGGPRDLEETLHETGHALAFASVRPDLPWEERQLWFEEVAEAFAYLIARLARTPSFLIQKIGLSPKDADQFACYAAFIELLMVRRYCAKILFESEWLATGTQLGSLGSYADLMEQAIGLRPDPICALYETDESLYAIDYLRAWFLEVHLNRTLNDAFGANWYARRRSFDQLGSLWQRGGSLDGQGLSLVIGCDPNDCTALVMDLAQEVARGIPS
jgi:hypothetical protein